MDKQPRGRVDPVVPKGTPLPVASKGYRESVMHDTKNRLACEDFGHTTALFSRFCTSCGWILTDAEDAERR